ncbi:hypothetical protein TanjilG_10973 [Lupinus angustifolius]|uniref:Uncharacterized protein n=1 Tax=Lupinus angustifolius TaxID=3871 RepID=A0A394DQ06_LUPAN|nr:hypothetical protein TanjilG_10973 [Lupinus angustifolius]
MAKPSSPKRPTDGEASKPPSFFVYGSGQPRARRHWFVMVVIRGDSVPFALTTRWTTRFSTWLIKSHALGNLKCC